MISGRDADKALASGCQNGDESHMSKSYFMGMFKKYVGTGAVAYINQLRVQYACELLKTEGKNVSEIAFSSGFTNLSNFNRLL